MSATETEYQINVYVNVFTTVRANNEDDAHSAAYDAIKRLTKKADLTILDDYEIVEFETYDFNEVEID